MKYASRFGVSLFVSLLIASPAKAVLPGEEIAPQHGIKNVAHAIGLPAWALSAITHDAKGNPVAHVDASSSLLTAVTGDLGQAGSTASLVSVLSAGAAKDGGQVQASETKGVRGVVKLTATARGIEIVNAQARAMLDSAGKVVLVQGTLPTSFQPQNERQLSSQQALASARTEYGVQGESRIADQVQPVFFATESGLLHAYRVRIASRSPMADIEAVVDASDGAILSSADYMVHITGHGSVYEESPLTGDPASQELPNLNGDGTLSGAHAKSHNEKGADAKSSNNEFAYAPSDTHFDEVQVYYWADRIHSWYASHLSFTGLDDHAMMCNVHVGDHYDNAYFSPWDGTLNFGDGQKLNDLSKDATVIYHEYTHAVTNSLAPDLHNGLGSALHEGYSDYFAATILNDPIIGAYAGQRLPSHNIRDCTNHFHAPEDQTGEPHKDGSIWAAACWDLRGALGADVSDPIIHASRAGLSGEVTFADAMRGVVAADQQQFGGAHKSQIESVYGARGIASSQVSAMSLLRRHEGFATLFPGVD